MSSSAAPKPKSTPKPAARPTAKAAARRRGQGAAVRAADFDALSDSLGYAIKRAQVRSYDLYFEMLADQEISPARMTALSIIATTPEIMQAELAQRLNIAGPSVVKVIDTLEALQLVSREAHAGDRRRYALVLTERGRRKLAGYKARLDAYEQRIAAGLSAAERRQLLDLLERVAR